MNYKNKLFKGLTRPVTYVGLPINYMIFMSCIIMIGFIITTSFIYIIISLPLSYICLRIVASVDSRFFDVLITVMQRTPFVPSILKGKGVLYRA